MAPSKVPEETHVDWELPSKTNDLARVRPTWDVREKHERRREFRAI